MKRFLKTLVFQIGVDVLGFPQFCKHTFPNYETANFEPRTYATKFHEKWHKAKKNPR